MILQYTDVRYFAYLVLSLLERLFVEIFDHLLEDKVLP